MSTDKQDGWIEWSGGECPVAGDTLVDVELRDGFRMCSIASDFSPHGEPATAQNSNWHHDGGDLDIVRYQVVPA